MKTFDLTLFEGHPIIKDGDNIILIDTGAPTTINKSNQINFLSEAYDTSTDYMGLNTEKLSGMIGTQITSLLGTDILYNYKIIFDYKNLKVTFSLDDIEFDGTSVLLDSFMEVPIIELGIENQKISCFLDTGAKLSYLPNSLMQGHKSLGKKEDFYPGVGKFETQCYEITTSLGTEQFTAQYGNLPTMLEMALDLGGVEGIIGYDFFNNFKVFLDLENSKLKYVKQPN